MPDCKSAKGVVHLGVHGEDVVIALNGKWFLFKFKNNEGDNDFKLEFRIVIDSLHETKTTRSPVGVEQLK
jgi:hypothetical protein